MLEKLAIVILNYNSHELTIRAVSSISALNTEAEIVIVDNRSSDSSARIISDYINGINKTHLLQCDKNLGYAVGNNVGISYIREYLTNIDTVAIMNPDITVRNIETLETLYEVLHKNEKIGAITTKTRFNGNISEPNECAWRFMTPKVMAFNGTILGKLMNFQAYYDNFDVCQDGYAYVDVVQGCFFMIRMDVLKEIGNFDENTFLYTEESILAKKMSRHGYINAVVPEIIVEHNHEDKGKKLNNKENKLFDMKCYYSSRKYYIKEYSQTSNFFKLFASSFLSLDYAIKKILLYLNTITEE